MTMKSGLEARGGELTGLPEKKEALWWLAVSPAIWATHFLVSYVTAAVWCARVVGRDGSLASVRIAIGIYTVVALSGIVLTGFRGLRRRRVALDSAPYDADTPEDRTTFLGFATVLLSALSAVATIYVALAALFMKTCA